MKLGDEHIIPESLGGTLILPEASCGECEGRTGSAEQFCGRDMLNALRCQLDLPSKRPKDRPKTLPVRLLVNGVWITERVAIADFPLVVTMPRLPWPGILMPPDQQPEHFPLEFAVKDFSCESAKSELLARYEATHIAASQGSIRIDKFGRMLAKIAHSFATAELGLGAFQPLLLDVIRGTSENPTLHVGGIPADEGEGRSQHELTLQYIDRAGDWFVCVRIRLFADLGFPTYYCVVGAA